MPRLLISYLDQTKVLVYISAHWQVIDANVSHNLLVVDDETSSVTDSCIVEHSVGISDLLTEVGQQRDVDVSQSSVFPRFLGVLHVREMRVDGAANNFATDFSEVLGFVGKIKDFSGADECEVKRVKEKQEPLVLEVVKADFLEGLSIAVPGVDLEEGCGLSDNSSDRV